MTAVGLETEQFFHNIKHLCS